MSKVTNKLLKEVKKQNQDFEWYPTTREIIEAMYWDLLGDKVDESTYRAEGRRYSMLDIGAGNGKVHSVIKEIAEEQPLLEQYFYYKNGQFPREDSDSKSWRNENERLANRVSIDKYMVIEKSEILVEAMPKETLVVGMDFKENTIIDKQSDIVFCNPPYTEYVEWSSKIIREANAKTIYLVIPQRWGKDKSIAQALKDRKAKVKIIGNFDFINAEDRKARAYVSLVKVELDSHKFRGKRVSGRNSTINVDPFDLWFNDTFKIKADKEKQTSHFHEAEKKKTSFDERVKNELVSGNDLITVLVELYNLDMQKLMNNYMKLSEIDAELFKELDVNIDSVLAALKEKIHGKKNFYWEEIFKNLTKLTSRLTRSTREKLKQKLMSNASIDFNTSNIRTVVVWALKNANHYYEEQMLDLYDSFTTEEGINLYKSNKHFHEDNFRYNRNDKSAEKYALDYRIILHYWLSDWDTERGEISDRQVENIQDAMVIARNLGFTLNQSQFDFTNRNHNFAYGKKSNLYFSGRENILRKGAKTHDGKIEEVYMHTGTPNENGERVMDKDGITYVYSEENEIDWLQYKIDELYLDASQVRVDADIFTTVKTHKNGNCHFQFNKKFMQKLNLEVGRIRGWLKNPAHAAQEMDISIEEASEYWESSFTLLPSSLDSLLPAPKDEVQDHDEKHSVMINGKEVAISFEPDRAYIHCGDMLEYNGDWIEISFSSDHKLTLCDKNLPDVLEEVTGHKSNFKRIELIKSIYDDITSPSMEYYAQRNLIASDVRLDDYDVHLQVLNYAYWFYDLEYAPIDLIPKAVIVVDVLEEEIIPANILIVSSAIKSTDFKEIEITEANANGTLF